MGEKVRIAIKGQRFMDGEKESVDMSADGNYYRRDGKYYILYEATTEDRGTVRNLVKVSPDCLEITKSGEIRSSMVFRQGKKTETAYRTFVGRLSMGIGTRRLEVLERDGELEILVDYSIEINGQQVSDSILAITVSHQGDRD